jgi:DNA-binding MarR family transcriptional regulator
MDAVRSACHEVAETCALFNLRRASRTITQLYESLMARSGLTGPQFGVLVALSLKEEWTLTALAGALLVDRTTLTRNLSLMEKAGLVKVKSGPDRRERRITMSSAGQGSLARAIPLWKKAQESVADVVGKERLSRLVSELKTVSALLAQH